MVQSLSHFAHAIAKAGASQHVNHSAEMQSLGEHEMPTVQQKCIMLGNTKREPFVGNSVTQNVNRPAEIQSPGQPSRIRKSSIPYHSDMVAGRGLAEEDDFEVIRGAAIDADTYLGYHHRSLVDRRRMLKSTNEGTITAA